MGRDVGAVTFPQNPKMLITIRTESGEHIPETLICLRKVPRKNYTIIWDFFSHISGSVRSGVWGSRY